MSPVADAGPRLRGTDFLLAREPMASAQEAEAGMRSVKAREPVFPAQSAASPSSSTLTISSLPRAWLICIGICHLNHQRCGTSAMAANGACPRTPGTRRKTPRCRAPRDSGPSAHKASPSTSFGSCGTHQ